MQRFEELGTFHNVIQPQLDEVFHKDHPLKGRWNSTVFSNNYPIVLELGCGKGEYTIGLANQCPAKNFIGLDIKGARMWKGAKYANQNQLQNVGFLRMRIDHIVSVFARNEVSEIWITFPDPHVNPGRAKKRLTSSIFLSSYQQILKHDGMIHLKTDNDRLYDYTLRMCEHNRLEIKYHTDDLYHSLRMDPSLAIQTFYESQFLDKGLTIKYICFKLNSTGSIEEPDDGLME